MVGGPHTRTVVQDEMECGARVGLTVLDMAAYRSPDFGVGDSGPQLVRGLVLQACTGGGVPLSWCVAARCTPVPRLSNRADKQ